VGTGRPLGREREAVCVPCPGHIGKEQLVTECSWRLSIGLTPDKEVYEALHIPREGVGTGGGD
jgi:hypothetical protein